MQLEAKQVEGRAIVFLNGYLNEKGGELLEQACQGLLSGGVRGLQLDFASTSLVNSIGISYLLDIIDGAERGNVDLEFARVPDHIRELFDLLGITTRVPVRQL
jgi:anti-anti-sigma regulatory factor